MRRLLFLALLIFLFPVQATSAGAPAGTSLDFHAIRLGNAPDTVLVVGGIQGDEPGGFSAATLLSTCYEILDGSLLVVPNLNFPSIIKRSRGLHGDMNRKFARLDTEDPQYPAVRRIQELISDPSVVMVLNLHDGSGFYRPVFEDKMRNPKRWGQSIIIDQETMDVPGHLGNLYKYAMQSAQKANSSLLKPHHKVHIRNTRTAEGDKEMEKSLSYYAVRHNKPAFGLEASKEFPVIERAYYHLLMIEEFLSIAGVRFQRTFDLTPEGIAKALAQYLGVSFGENKIFLPLENARSTIRYLPLRKGEVENAILSKPIMAVLPCSDNSDQVCVHFGNRLVTHIDPEWIEGDSSIEGIMITVDGKPRFASFGQIIEVKNSLLVNKIPGYRVNAIGFDNGSADESDIVLAKKDFKERFSVDQAGNLFRIEVYRDRKFSGMFLARFESSRPKETKEIVPAISGDESSLGF